jgi:hypothetical protein
MPFEQPSATARPAAPAPEPLQTTLARPPVTAGSLASRTIRIWWQNVWRFAGVLAFIFVPIFVLGTVAAIAIPNLVRRGAQPEQVLPWAFGLVALLVVVLLPLSMIMLGGLNYGVVQHLAGRRVGVGAMLRQGARRIWPLTAALVLVMLAVMGGYVLLIVPGVMIAIATSVVLPAVMVEGLGATAAFRRSLELTRGYRWTLLGAFLLVFLLQFAFNIAGNLASLIHPAVGAIASLVLILPAASLSWIVPAVAYHDLRVAKEGVDTSALARVFE